MLSVSPLRISKDEFDSQREMAGLGIVGARDDDNFAEFSDGNLLESINFDDLFVCDGDVLPDLEMAPEILAEFSVSGGEESSEMNSSSVSVENNINNNSSSVNNNNNNKNKIESDHHQHQTTVMATTKEEEDEEYENKVCSASASGSGISDSNSGPSSGGGDREEIVKPSLKEASKARKSSAQSKDSQGKRKVKVDWTPELHRRFVQAVEQLGVDKAVPSKILEIMGIACLTRHNIASHLQKYRSHRKHLLVREAEAARWTSQRREIYGGGGGGGGKRKVSPWPEPTLGYPQMVLPMHHFRPLHVWGHPTPTMDHSFMPIWPQPYHRQHQHHLPHPPSAPPAWPPATTSPPLDPSFWHHHQRFGSPPVPGMPPHAMFKVDPGVSFSTWQPAQPPLDFHPSKESIDAAIEDVLSKPWLPLPLGLKAPALDSVLSELQRQGIPKIPPSCA